MDQQANVVRLVSTCTVPVDFDFNKENKVNPNPNADIFGL